MQLEIRDLTVKYGRAEALKGINMQVDQGELVALIGANGAGKTTLMRTISGLKSASFGQIVFEDERIDKLRAHEVVKRGIAHVPEGRLVFAPMTVMDNLRMGAYLRGDKAQVEADFQDMFEHFPVLKERRNQRAGSLSGGEQQMLAISRAMMIEPKLLMLDEPSLGLAPIIVEEVFGLIAKIAKEGMSILIVEQNLVQALGIASRAYVLETGRIVMEGSAKELLENEEIKHAYLGV